MIELILIIVGVVVALLLIGLLMPRRASRRKETRIGVPRPRVWAALVDIRGHPRWHPDIDEVEGIGEGRWRLRRTDGAEHVMEIREEHAPERVRWRFEETHGAYRGTWRLTLIEDGEGTLIRGVHRDEVRNPLMRVVAMLRGGRHSGLTEFLEELRVHLERGDAAPPAEH